MDGLQKQGGKSGIGIASAVVRKGILQLHHESEAWR